MGLSQEILLGVEASREVPCHALYEKLAGLGWSSTRINELKVVATLLLKQQRLEVRAK
jgi:hypothetical protein